MYIKVGYLIKIDRRITIEMSLIKHYGKWKKSTIRMINTPLLCGI